ncbi:cell envelope integrity protein CreD [Flaviaesturariibacter amylovorans]|uniref:Cell envelope integrity protein CreD n=1 Tax=Flaviaesturariibacter amylovorans TaxID=1084520 RepID=A0ABP8GDU1_9BACT
MNDLKKEIWSQTRLLVKVGLIGLIMAVLMIPTWQVRELIREREARQQEAVKEVSSKWAGRQVLTGPQLVLPYRSSAPTLRGDTVTTVLHAVLLPDSADVRGNVQPKEKHRGIYTVMLYSASVQLSGSFRAPDLAALRIDPAQVLWGDAFVRMQVDDLRGLSGELALRWNDRTLRFSPEPSTSDSGTVLTAPLPLAGIADLEGARFNGAIALNGAQQLRVAPLGRRSSITLASSWPHPSFSGDGLPEEQQVTKSGFTATWILGANQRQLPQQFLAADRGRSFSPAPMSVGVDLFQPVGAYQKTMRSIKYALLCILLTFAAFFLMERVHQKAVHPFQYGLIGLALVLFYVLLLSFSEYVGFNGAYAIASVATIGLITWFVRGVLESGRLSVLLAAVLVLLYGYVFTILQLQDYALLLGSVGLFATLAVTMHFSRRIKW